MLISSGFGRSRWFDCIVAEDHGRIVGFALYCRRFEAHTQRRCLWLGDLAVAPAVRRRGIGRKLVSEVRERARRSGCSDIVLDLWHANAAAELFYEHLGAERAEGVILLLLPARE